MLHQIGIGTLGPVFRTYEPTRDRLVAVKAFRLDIVPETAYALATGLSRAAQASLFHPSIVEPIEAGVEGTLAYRAEEYVAAESLDVAMRHYAPAPIEKVLPFITQLAGAIDFARAAGVGHGGLHPRDIFVTPDEARATGFGVVEALEQVGIRAPIRRPYSAPERIDGRAWGTPADVFSLAAITFELLSGKRPSGTGGQIGALPDGDHVAALQAVLARAMDDDPAKRHASALAFAGALEAASQGRRITEVVPTIPRTPADAPVPDATIPAPDIVKPEIPKPVGAVEPVVAPAIVAPPAPPPQLPQPMPIVASAPTPGEFGVDAALDPVHEALEDLADHPVRAAGIVEPFARRDAKRDVGLFDDEDSAGQESHERFAFLDEEENEEAEDHEIEIAARPGRTVEVARDDPDEDAPDETAAHEHAAAYDETPAEAAMFQTIEREGRLADSDEGRPTLLPYAVVSILMLLIGFAGGYFVRDRASLGQETGETASAAKGADTPSASAPSAGASTSPRTATPEKPRQYSEQTVTPPSTPPPVVHETVPPPVTRPAPAPAAAASGQIVVRSLPSHAGVTLNGSWRGRTPLTLDDVAFGTYIVRVVQPGYRVARDEFTLSAREATRTFTARLEPVGPAAPAPPTPAEAARPVFTGSLYVDSRPRGASVTVDGKSVGQTPVTVPEMAAGSHVVRIEMQGKKPVTANPRIVAGQTERVTVSLEDQQDASVAVYGGPSSSRQGRR